MYILTKRKELLGKIKALLTKRAFCPGVEK